jgi:predicted nucleotidyltransferase
MGGTMKTQSILTASGAYENVFFILKTVPVEKIYLFGSYVYGTPNKNSDLDFFVVLPDDSGIRPCDAQPDIYMSFCDMNRKHPVDMLASTSGRFAERSLMRATVEREVAERGVLLYV